MAKNLETFEKKRSELSSQTVQELVEMYRETGRYYTGILRNMTDAIFK